MREREEKDCYSEVHEYLLLFNNHYHYYYYYYYYHYYYYHLSLLLLLLLLSLYHYYYYYYVQCFNICHFTDIPNFHCPVKRRAKQLISSLLEN